MRNVFSWILAMMSLFSCMSFIRKLKDQRGEIAPDDTGDEGKEAEDNLDDVDLDLGEEKIDDDPEKDDEEEEKEDPPPVDEKSDPVKDLNDKLAKQAEQIRMFGGNEDYHPQLAFNQALMSAILPSRSF